MVKFRARDGQARERYDRHLVKLEFGSGACGGRYATLRCYATPGCTGRRGVRWACSRCCQKPGRQRRALSKRRRGVTLQSEKQRRQSGVLDWLSERQTGGRARCVLDARGRGREGVSFELCGNKAREQALLALAGSLDAVAGKKRREAKVG